MTKVSKEQIAEWKKKHGDIFLLTVDGHEAYLKKPSRQEVGFATVAGKTNPIKFNETLLKGCFLGGDEAIMKDDDLFLSVSAQLAELIGTKEAELVKL